MRDDKVIAIIIFFFIMSAFLFYYHPWVTHNSMETSFEEMYGIHMNLKTTWTPWGYEFVTLSESGDIIGEGRFNVFGDIVNFSWK